MDCREGDSTGVAPRVGVGSRRGGGTEDGWREIVDTRHGGSKGVTVRVVPVFTHPESPIPLLPLVLLPPLFLGGTSGAGHDSKDLGSRFLLADGLFPSRRRVGVRSLTLPDKDRGGDKTLGPGLRHCPSPKDSTPLRLPGTRETSKSINFSWKRSLSGPSPRPCRGPPLTHDHGQPGVLPKDLLH